MIVVVFVYIDGVDNGCQLWFECKGVVDYVGEYVIVVGWYEVVVFCIEWDVQIDGVFVGMVQLVSQYFAWWVIIEFYQWFIVGYQFGQLW